MFAHYQVRREDMGQDAWSKTVT